MDFVVQNWQHVFDDTYRLFEKIKSSGYKPDMIIGIARGGWIPARLIADFLHLKQTANMKVETYQMIGDVDVEAKITQTLSDNIEGKNVLIVDDVADSGVTLKAVLDSVNDLHPKDLKTAMLYYKPRSIIVPDYYVHKTAAWVIFSWSMYETIHEFNEMWTKEGMSTGEIIQKCKEIGIPPTVTNSYFA